MQRMYLIGILKGGASFSGSEGFRSFWKENNPQFRFPMRATVYLFQIFLSPYLKEHYLEGIYLVWLENMQEVIQDITKKTGVYLVFDESPINVWTETGATGCGYLIKLRV